MIILPDCQALVSSILFLNLSAMKIVVYMSASGYNSRRASTTFSAPPFWKKKVVGNCDFGLLGSYLIGHKNMD